MSSYGHFIVEVRQKDNKWKRIYWKSDKDLYYYTSKDDDIVDNDYIHKYATVGQYYQFRDNLNNEGLGYNGMCKDFTQETKDEIEKWTKENYGWYEGYFYLNDLSNWVAKKKRELDDEKSNNMQRAIYEEVKKISAKLNGEEYEKPEFLIEPFSEDYDENYEWIEEDYSTAQYIYNAISFLVEEICGWTEDKDIRVIVLAG